MPLYLSTCPSCTSRRHHSYASTAGEPSYGCHAPSRTTTVAPTLPYSRSRLGDTTPTPAPCLPALTPSVLRKPVPPRLTTPARSPRRRRRTLARHGTARIAAKTRDRPRSEPATPVARRHALRPARCWLPARPRSRAATVGFVGDVRVPIGDCSTAHVRTHACVSLAGRSRIRYTACETLAYCRCSRTWTGSIRRTAASFTPEIRWASVFRLPRMRPSATC